MHHPALRRIAQSHPPARPKPRAERRHAEQKQESYQGSTASAGRDIPKNRMKRIRVSWFCLGAFASLAAQLLVTVSLSGISMPSVSLPSLPEMPKVSGSFLPNLDKLKTPTLDTAADNDSSEPAETELAKEEPIAPPITYPREVEITVSSGDTLSNLLDEEHVSVDEVHTFISALKKVYNPRNIAEGDSFKLTLHKKPGAEFAHISFFEMRPTATHKIEMTRVADKLNAKKIKLPTKKIIAHAGGGIRGSLYETAIKDGMPSALLAPVTKALSYDVDFQRDIHPGNSFDILYESYMTEDGRHAGTGKVLYAKLKLRRKTLELYNHTHKDGSHAFYNAKGESVKKALLRTPINGAHITSGFGMRHHPILGYSKMHKGVDFGARSGTPIYASGDGTVKYAARKGGYGNFIEIKHNGKFSTAYAHLKKFAKGIRSGKRVKQGQVIGYVGTTGRSTGPHLHYELRAHGKQVNPSKVVLKTGNSLSGTELANFKKMKGQVQNELAKLNKPDTKLAQAE